MKEYLVNKSYKLTVTILSAFLFVFCTVCQAQNTGNNQTTNKKYVRFEIGHEAMHCPFLGPKLELKLSEIKDIENFFIDKRASYSTFNLPENTEMTIESLKKIGTDVGYPSNDIFITMDNKPIIIPPKPIEKTGN